MLNNDEQGFEDLLTFDENGDQADEEEQTEIKKEQKEWMIQFLKIKYKKKIFDFFGSAGSRSNEIATSNLQ